MILLSPSDKRSLKREHWELRTGVDECLRAHRTVCIVDTSDRDRIEVLQHTVCEFPRPNDRSSLATAGAVVWRQLSEETAQATGVAQTDVERRASQSVS